MRIRIPYWILLIGPTLSFWIGLTLNALVMAANHGQMPVLWPGGCPQFTDPSNPFQDSGMIVHACMTSASHLKFLADWYIIHGIGSASIGDAFITLYNYSLVPAIAAWLALVIRDYN